MGVLARRWPESIAFDELLAAAATGRSREAVDWRKLASDLLHAFTCGLVELSPAPPRAVPPTCPRPQRPALMRGSALAKVPKS